MGKLRDVTAANAAQDSGFGAAGKRLFPHPLFQGEGIENAGARRGGRSLRLPLTLTLSLLKKGERG